MIRESREALAARRRRASSDPRCGHRRRRRYVTAACARASARITSSCQIDSAMNSATAAPKIAGDGFAGSIDRRVDHRGDEDRDLGVAEMNVRSLARCRRQLRDRVCGRRIPRGAVARWVSTSCRSYCVAEPGVRRNAAKTDVKVPVPVTKARQAAGSVDGSRLGWWVIWCGWLAGL